ncbi:MAG: DUF4412 domain-containing protein [Labilithrix sp.]|nr:DUF4412 domain-containing protein [Labilithrix sp.]MBX3224555.1 DUF4412 domain-containing protein [Labilithrix sp.]
MPARRARRGALLAGCLGLGLLSSGCDKLKAAMNKGDADAATPAPGAGGGLASFFGSDFEGEITSTLTTRGKPTTDGPAQIVMGIKKPRYRVDLVDAPSKTPTPAQAGAIILDPPSKKGWLLVPAQKTAMLLDLEKMKSLPKGQLPGLPNAPKGTPALPSSPPKIDKTGKKDVVAGYSCDVWNVTADGKKTEVCVAEGITWVDLGDLGWSSPELTLAAVATEANRFPLRAITFDAAGAEETRMEATKVDKKKLDDSRFVVPPDYRVIDMAAMMGGLNGLPGLPGNPNAAPKTRAR